MVDLIDGVDALATEQATLDELDDKVAEISDRIIQLKLDSGVTSKGASTTIHPLVYLAKRLRYIEENLFSIEEDFRHLTPDTGLDCCLVQQLNKRVNKILDKLREVSREVLSLDEGEEKLLEKVSTIEKASLDLNLQIKRMVRYTSADTPRKPTTSLGIKLPKIDVPTFKGDIMEWQGFWEQFNVSVHS